MEALRRRNDDGVVKVPCRRYKSVMEVSRRRCEGVREALGRRHEAFMKAVISRRYEDAMEAGGAAGVAQVVGAVGL